MYSSSGKLQSKNENVARCDFLASKGQNGGGVTWKGKDTLLAIYTDCVDDPSEGGKLGYCARINDKVVEFVDNLADNVWNE